MEESRVGAYGVLIHNGAVLLIKKALGPYTGTLDLPGGKIEFGESPYDTVVREFDEETGLAVTPTGLLPPFSFLYQNRFHHLGFFFAVAWAGRGELRTGPDGLDSSGALWVPLDELDRHRLSPLTEYGLNRPSTWVERNL